MGIGKVYLTCHFSSAHRLSNYKGNCQRLHGHNWKVEVEIWGKKKEGMVIDFNEIKKEIRAYDHKLLLMKNYENLCLFKHLPNDWVVWLDFEPTAENLANFKRY